MNVLFISAWWPYPADNGSKLRIYNLLQQLAKVYSVTLLSFFEPDELLPERLAHLQTFCKHVEAVPSAAVNVNKLQSLQGYLSPLPRSLVYKYSPQMADRVRAHVEAGDVDVIIVTLKRVT